MWHKPKSFKVKNTTLNSFTLDQLYLLRDAMEVVDPDTTKSFEDKEILLGELNYEIRCKTQNGDFNENS